MKSNLIKGLSLVLVIAGSMAIGVYGDKYYTQYKNNSIRAQGYSVPRGDKFEVVNVYTKPNGDIITEYNNGSTALCNDKNGIYMFFPVELGDWEYTVSTKEDFLKVIETYKSVYENGYF